MTQTQEKFPVAFMVKRDANENDLETQSAHSSWEFTRETVGKWTLCTRLVQM